MYNTNFLPITTYWLSYVVVLYTSSPQSIMLPPRITANVAFSTLLKLERVECLTPLAKKWSSSVLSNLFAKNSDISSLVETCLAYMKPCWIFFTHKTPINVNICCHLLKWISPYLDCRRTVTIHSFSGFCISTLSSLKTSLNLKLQPLQNSCYCLCLAPSTASCIFEFEESKELQASSCIPWLIF